MNKLYKTLIIIILIITLINVYLFYFFQKNTKETDSLVKNNQEIIFRTSKLLSYLIDAETGQRGFLLTNKLEYLNPYNQGLTNSQNEINRIKILLKDDDIRFKNIENIEQQVLEKFDFLAETIVLANENISLAIELVNSDKGKIIMDKIREKINNFISFETNLLNGYVETHEKSLNQLIFSLFLELLLIFVLLYSLFIINNNLKSISQKIELQNNELNEKNKLLYDEQEKTSQALEEAQASEEELLASQEELLEIQEKLIYANEAKSEFLSNMSHEIRTPLNGIIGFIDILMEAKPRADQIEYLNILKKSSNALKGIINDILDFSKIQAGKFQIVKSHFSLFEQIENVKHLFTYQIEQKGLKFNIDIDEDVENIINTDELRLGQILINLIGNAYKFTDKGLIYLHVSVLEKNNNNLVLKFSIVDTGIGIDEKIQPILFDSFTQGELSNTKKFQGTGLGLSISKSLIELMGGEIWFESFVGVGTKFHFTLPAEFIRKEEVSANILNKKITKFKLKDYKKALVAEDSEINQIVIENTLGKIGFDIDFANDGYEALEKAKNYSYDIIFMDIQMPNLDGYEATKRIRNFNKKIPIFALSAAVMYEEIQHSLDCGMNAHIKKPIEKEELSENLIKYFDLIEIFDTEKINSDTFDSNKIVFDIDKISLKRDMPKDFVYELIEMFKNNFNEYPQKILECDNEKDLDFLIHKLKSAVGNLLLEEVFELCELYEINSYEKKQILVRKISKILEEYVV